MTQEALAANEGMSQLNEAEDTPYEFTSTAAPNTVEIGLQGSSGRDLHQL
jgi:hypothetical protein